jgi:hypothetical protein
VGDGGRFGGGYVVIGGLFIWRYVFKKKCFKKIMKKEW